MSDADNLTPFPDRNAIDAAAADWLLTVEEGALSPDQAAAFEAWRAASPLHAAAYDRLAGVWGAFDEAKALADFAGTEEDAEVLRQDRVGATVPVWQRRSFLAVAASLAVAVGLGVAVQMQPPPADMYQTAVGEQADVALPDGSSIEMNTDSRLGVTYAPAARIVRLERGEAYFDVAPDQDKPFTVQTPHGAVTAVGTAFTVRVRGGEIDVLVAEGRVALTPPGAGVTDPGAPQLVAGQRAVYDRTVEQVETLAPTAMAQELSWRQGMLAFSGSTLADVVRDIGRYTDVTIVIADENLHALPVTGYFGIGEVEEMIEALELMAGLTAERRGDRMVVLSRAPTR